MASRAFVLHVIGERSIEETAKWLISTHLHSTAKFSGSEIGGLFELTPALICIFIVQITVFILVYESESVLGYMRL